MNLDPDVVAYNRANEAGSLWQVSVSVEGRNPVDMLVDNSINSILVQALARLDYDEIPANEAQLLVAAALVALQPYSTVGLTRFGSGIFLRSAFFIDHSTIHAFTNTLKGVALAYEAYLTQLPLTAASLQG
jgi:hypothetical protein